MAQGRKQRLLSWRLRTKAAAIAKTTGIPLDMTNAARTRGKSVLPKNRAAFVMSRGIPVVLAMAAAWYVRRQLNSRACGPVPLASLLSLAMVLRLVFESNLFGYYFMATAVALILLGVAAGKLSGQLLVWLGLVTLVFNPVNWTVQADNHSSWSSLLRIASSRSVACDPLSHRPTGNSTQVSLVSRCNFSSHSGGHCAGRLGAVPPTDSHSRYGYGKSSSLPPALYLAVQPYIARHLNLDYGPAVPGCGDPQRRLGTLQSRVPSCVVASRR